MAGLHPMLWRGKAVDRPPLARLADAHQYGRRWYHDSAASIELYADRNGYSSEYVSTVLAILSPRVTVDRNVKLACEYLDTGHVVKGLMQSRRRALMRYETWGEVSGPKVNAFARALQRDPSACVVDAWVFRLLGLDPSIRSNYHRAVKAIRRTASALDWPPAETQASLWCGARMLCGFGDRYSPLLMPQGAA